MMERSPVNPVANYLCNLYFFSDPNADSLSPDMERIRLRAQKAINSKNVRGFHYVKVNDFYIPLSEAVRRAGDSSPSRAFYPHAAVLRRDGAVVGLYLSSGRSTLYSTLSSAP